MLIGAANWIAPAIALFAVAVVTIALAYRHVPRGFGIRAVCGGLKALGLAALAICLVHPLYSGIRARPGANLFVLLADNSAGMTIRDRGENKTRGEELKTALTAESAWRTRLMQDFEVRRYEFDNGAQSVEDFATLKFDGTGSALNASLKTIAHRFRDRPFAGILLFTDGNATDLDEGSLDVKGLPPIYPVVTGQDRPKNDIAIISVSISNSSFEDAPVTIRADVEATGYAGKEILAQLLDENDKAVTEETLKAPDEEKTFTFRLQLRPTKQGVSFYKLRVSSKKDVEQFENPAASREATLANNSRLLAIKRGERPYRVLYVSGRPNWEYKFLRRAIDEDQQIDLVGLIRVAKREAKFRWRDNRRESANPLFTGFKKSEDEDTEQYDEPVLVRMNTADDAELRDGFPKTAEKLFAYDAVIVDDLEVGFFTRDQLSLLERFVNERGSSFLMLGGQESFRNGEYHRTPIGDMLPVYLDRVPAAKRTVLRLSLTRDGWLQPWLRLRKNEQDEQQRLATMPAFRTLNRVRSVKPGAMVLARMTAPGGETHPALVAQKYGTGRAAAMLLGDSWRWALKREPGNDDHAKAWRQMLRWLVTDVPGRVSLQIKTSQAGQGSRVQLQVRARDAEFRPLDNATVTITVQPVSGEEITLDTEASLEEAGLYVAEFVPRQPGGFLATATAVDGDGEEAGKAQTGWAVDRAADEFRVLRPNRTLLESLAEKTGGEVLEMDDLESFARGLPNRKAPITERYTFPLWHQSFVFLFVIGCFVSEWGLRRYKGLP